MTLYPDRSQVVIFPDVSDFQRPMDGARLKREGHGALAYKIAASVVFSLVGSQVGVSTTPAVLPTGLDSAEPSKK